MDRFSRVLRRVERRLQAPEPKRSRILMEMASDLEDLYQAYRDRGLDESEARRRAEQWIAPGTPAIESLQAVHLPAFDRLLERLSGTARGRIELALVTGVSVLAVGGALVGALRSGALSASSPALWIVASLVAGGVGIAARQGYALFVRGDRLGSGWRRELRRVLAVAVGAALVGPLEGVLRLSLTAVSTPDAGVPAGLWAELATASGVAALGLSGSLLLALLWLLLRVRAEVVGRARTALRETMESMEAKGTQLEQETER